jgi:hypothetical protein
MKAVIAERELTLTDGGAGFVRMYMPEADGDAQVCELHLAWPGFDQRQRIYGVDSWQCVLEAIRIAPLFISLTDDYKTGRLMLYDASLRQPLPKDPHHRTGLEVFFDVEPHPRDTQ